MLVGAAITLKPFASLALLTAVVVVGLVVTGVVELVGARGRDGRWRWASGVVSLGAALVIVLWPGPSLRVLALVVGVVLVVNGVLDVVRRRRVAGDAGDPGPLRWARYLRGGTSVVCGLLALAWPDLTLIVVAVVFGIRVVVVGVHAVVDALRPRSPGPARAVEQRTRRGWWVLTRQCVGTALALVLAAVSLSVHADRSVPDDFYAAPRTVPSTPGALLRSQPFSSPEVPSNARAWRILYTTTVADGRPAVASALVVAPRTAPPSGGFDTVAWAHGTTGASPACAPSLLPGGLAKGAMFVQDEIVDRGWALVATDYVGLGTRGPHPYLVGQPEGRSVLDSIRAAQQLTAARLGRRTVIWGHSQGGHAALWAGGLASSYAPDLTISGVAALAPASNPPALLANLDNVPGGDLFASYVVKGYTSSYPDVRYDALVRPTAQTVVGELGDRCLSGKGVVVSIVTSLLLDKPIWRGDPDRGAFRDALRANSPTGRITAPLLIAQGDEDSIVVPSSQTAYVEARCAAGQALDYRRYPGLDHVPLVEPESPAITALLSWTSDRFAGRAATPTCRAAAPKAAQ